MVLRSFLVAWKPKRYTWTRSDGARFSLKLPRLGPSRGYARDLAERALAHTIVNKVDAAYHRTDLLEQ
jgi:hypothetical protein